MLYGDDCNPRRWHEEIGLRHHLGTRFWKGCEAFQSPRATTVCASSMVAYLNRLAAELLLHAATPGDRVPEPAALLPPEQSTAALQRPRGAGSEIRLSNS